MPITVIDASGVAEREASVEQGSKGGALRLCVVQLDGVPQALTENERLWIPTEPLVDPTTRPELAERELSAAHLFSASAGDSARNILRKVHELGTDATRGRLSEILTFVEGHGADITVLPEYLIPVPCIDVLLGFSRRRAIIGGLGLIRNEDDAATVVAHAVDPVKPEDVIGRNVGVLVENERVHIVTKRSPAQHESVSPGSGPRLLSIEISGRPLRVGVALCMDYLRHEGELRDQSPDVVCVPAFTANTAAFLPDAPRDYIRLFANCAAHGGSTIFASSLSGPVFTDKIGVRPLGRAVEGLVMIEYDRPETRPTSLRRTENKLLLRAQILERHPDNDVALEAVRQLADLQESAAKDTAGDLGERLSRWLTHIEDDSPLSDALEEYRRSLAQELTAPDLYHLLCTHLTIAAGGSAKPVRAKQARFVVQRLGELIASGMEVPAPGRSLDAYSAIAKTVPDESETVRAQSDKHWTFSISLGTYERSSAASTLPRQLNFLRALSRLPAGSIGVTYRLRSELNAYGPDLLTYFDVIVDGDEDVVSADQVEGQLRSMLIESWTLTASSQVPTPKEGATIIRILPDMSGQPPAVREDWASVMDLLRTHSIPVSVDMRVEPIETMEDETRVSTEFDDERWLNKVSAIPFMMTVGDEADRRATAYFNVIGELSKSESRSLGLSITLSSEEPIPPLLVRTIQHELLGHLPAEIELVDAVSAHQSPTALSPSELIGLFHPPYGHIQGRGVPRSSDQEIPFQGRNFAAGGTYIGEARIAGPRRDRLVEVPLDETARARHLYVIGRTGTGKTNLLKELCRQDLVSGRGLAVFDPHGELVDYLMMHCDDRLAETVLLDFGAADALPAFNPLLVDMHDARSMAQHTNDFLKALEERSYNQFTGPVFGDMVRQALETMYESSFPVSRSIDLIEGMYRNSAIRQMVAQAIPSDSLLRARWNVFEGLSEREKAERITWMLSKFADLLPPDSPLRLSLSTTQSSPLSIEQIVWNQGVLLVKMPESSMGSDAASFLGALIVRRIQRAIFDYERGTGRSPSDRPTFTLCLDEFQKFATAGLESLVAEARKFGCGLILAHQNLEQLFAFSRFEGGRNRELLEAILGNVGSTVAFRVGPQDAAPVAELLRVKPDDLDRVPRFKALCRLVADSDDNPAFTLTVPDSARLRGTPAAAERLRTRMITDGYWIATDTAISEVSSHLSRFEAALAHTKEAVIDENRGQMSQAIHSLQSEPERAEEIFEDVFGDGETLINFYRDVFSSLLLSRGLASSDVRDEVANLLVTEFLSLVEGAATEDWESEYEQVADQIQTLIPVGEGLDERLLEGVRQAWHWSSSVEVDPANPATTGLGFIGGLVLMFVARPLDQNLLGSLAEAIASRHSMERLLSIVPDSALHRDLQILHSAWAEAINRSPWMSPPP